MKIKTVLWAAAGLLLAAPAFALIQPQTINFQGKLVSPSTNLPQTGLVGLTFNLYNVQSGGSSLWTETQNNVALGNGVFAVELGTYTALPRDLFLGASVYLGVTVVGDAAGEMLPRTRLVMSAYAFTANQLSDTGAVRLIADTVYSTFTNAGNLTVPAGLVGSSATLTNWLLASSATFTASGSGTAYALTVSSGLLIQNGTLDVNARGGITNSYGIVTATLTASSATFTASGSGTAYALTVSSGVQIQNGTLDVNGGGGISDRYGLVSGSANFTANGTTWTVVSSSGLLINQGEFQLGASGQRVMYDNASAAATAFSSNVAVAGALSAANFNWMFIASGTLAAAAATLTVAIPNTGLAVPQPNQYQIMRFEIYVPAALTVAANWELRFNGDAAANYASNVSDTLGAVSGGTSQAFILLTNSAQTQAGFCSVEGGAATTFPKIFSISCARTALVVTTTPRFSVGGGYWNNVASPITSVTLLNSGAGNYPASTTIRVYGVQ